MNNKLIFTTLLACAAIFTSCNNSPKEVAIESNDDNSQYLAQRCDSLENANQDLIEFIGTVAGCIDSISVDNITATLTTGETTNASRAKLLQRISSISATIENQKRKIKQLSAQIDSTKPEAKKLLLLVDNLKKQLAERESTIAKLKSEIEKNKTDISNLNKEIKELNVLTEQQEETLTEQDKIINTAYVKIASEKDLKNAGLLNGGGLFKKKKLDVSAINTKQFKEIDIRETTEFKIPGKKAKLLTQAPEGSYSLIDYGDNAVLRISNPTRFWSISNVLIISYK